MMEISINPKTDLIFDDKVREMCKSCKRYGKKATCPPYVESVAYYKKLLRRYQNCKLYYEKFNSSDKKRWRELGKRSSLEIHMKLLEERDKLFELGHYFVAIFGAGSCKLCDKCFFPCKSPDKSIIPFRDSYYRIGAIFYD